MMYGQLCNRDSLSDLVLTVNAHPQKAYHLGFGKRVSKTNLAKANEIRDWRIYQDFAYHLIAEARRICMSEDSTQFSFSNSVYAFDSTTIDLCLSVFWWATFRRAKAAIKLHTQYDVRTSIPVFIHITAGSVHDVHAMDNLVYEPGSFYIFDRGYLDFERLFIIHESKSFFVIRAKTNLKFKRQRIKFYDEEQKRSFVFLTNNLNLGPEEIAALYKHRWTVELFFKWVKQHLKIKSFWGTTENAVKTQVYIAVITYTLVAIIRQQLKSEYTTYEVLQILGSSLLDKTPINHLLKKQSDQDVKELLYNQLKIF
jgi:transposase